MGCDIHFYVEKRTVGATASGKARGTPPPPEDTPEWEQWATGQAVGDDAVRVGWQHYDPRPPRPQRPCDHKYRARQGTRTNAEGEQEAYSEPERIVEQADCDLCEGTGTVDDWGGGPRMRSPMMEWYDANFYSGRDYRLFSILAGVRGDCDPIKPEKGFPKDASPELREEFSGWGVDAHTPSYYTLRELVEFDWTKTATTEAILSAGEYAEWRQQLTRRESACPRGWCGGVGGGNTTVLDDTDDMDEILQRAGVLVEGQIVVPEEMPEGMAPFHHNLPGMATIAKVQHAVKEETGKMYYVKAEWEEPYHDIASYWWKITMPRLFAAWADGTDARTANLDDLRIVFWFDN